MIQFVCCCFISRLLKSSAKNITLNLNVLLFKQKQRNDNKTNTQNGTRTHSQSTTAPFIFSWLWNHTFRHIGKLFLVSVFFFFILNCTKGVEYCSMQIIRYRRNPFEPRPCTMCFSYKMVVLRTCSWVNQRKKTFRLSFRIHMSHKHMIFVRVVVVAVAAFSFQSKSVWMADGIYGVSYFFQTKDRIE